MRRLNATSGLPSYAVITNTLSYVAGLRATDESVPGPLRDVQTVRYILC
jgi:hypothetical protein